MKRVAQFGLVLLFGMSTQVAAQAPKPGPEVGKLAVWVGEWQYEGEVQASPIGPAAKVEGRMSGRLVMNGFALELTGEEKGPFGAVQWGEMDVYDSAAKNHLYLGYQNDGTMSSGAIVVSGSSWKFTGTMTSKGTAYKVRGENSLSADGKTWTSKNEISTDGKTWIPFYQGKMTEQ